VSNTGGKVVYLRRESANRSQPMPEAVERVRGLVDERLLTLIRRVLDEADDALFDGAHPAVGDGARDAWLRAMRDLRLRRHELEEIFRAGLEYRFSRLPSSKEAGDTDTPGAPADPADHSAREMALAVDALAAKARRRFSPQLVEVTRLLGQQYPGAEVREEDNPLDPACLARLFARATEMLQFALEPRLVLLKLFDRQLMRGLGPLYAEVETAITGRAPVVPVRPLSPRADGPLERDPGYGAPAEGAAAKRGDGDGGRGIRQEAEANRNQVEAARERVRREVRRCLEGRNPPRLVRELLEDTWARVLFITCLKEGVDSETWVRQCALMERLLWSVEWHQDPEVQQQLVVEIPLLLHELAEGLSWVLYNPFEMHKLLRALEAEHLKCLRAADPSLADAPVAVAAEGSGANPRDLEANGQRLRRVPVGTWFEFLRDHGRRLQGRLAGRRQEGEVMVFANRAGFKVLETTVDELAGGLADSSVLILDDNRLFNSALADVVRRLKERQAGQQD